MQPRRVLVVEDEGFTSGLVCAALRGAGLEVRASASAAEARREVAAFDPDAAVIDLNLGAGPNGIDLAHILSHQNPGVALLLLTKLPDLRAAGYTEADLPPDADSSARRLSPMLTCSCKQSRVPSLTRCSA